MFTRLDSPVLYCKNVSKTKAFYTDVMDFESEDEAGDFAVIRKNKIKIALNKADEEDKRAGFQTIILVSDSIEADYQAIRDRGIKMELELTDLGYGRTFIFRDIDENKIEVIEAQ